MPAAVVMSACQMPSASIPISTPDAAEAMRAKVLIIPITVPKRPNRGAVCPKRRKRDKRFSRACSTPSPVACRAASRLGWAESRRISAKGCSTSDCSRAWMRGVTSCVARLYRTRISILCAPLAGKRHCAKNKHRSIITANDTMEMPSNGHMSMPPRMSNSIVLSFVC